MHRQFPKLTYDVTIKIEHLLKYSDHLKTLRNTGCLFVTSAVESIDNRVLQILEKGHTRQDFLDALDRLRAADLTLTPTFIPFTPWTSRDDYRELLELLAEQDLIEHVSPIQLAIRLLIPSGSRLLELAEVRALVERFDAKRLTHLWVHSDPLMDELHQEILRFVAKTESENVSRQAVFDSIWDLASRVRKCGRSHRDNWTSCGDTSWLRQSFTAGTSTLPGSLTKPRLSRAAVPYLTEPWYC
jgi:hypothetical protein